MTEREGKHETRDVDVKKVVFSGAVFFVVAFGTLLVLRPIFDGLANLTRRGDMPTTPVLEVRAPALIDPNGEIKAASGEEVRKLREDEAETLATYGFVDRKNGVARVPIERAMAIIAERGLPARPSAAATSTSAKPPIPLGETNGFSAGGVP